MSTREATTTAVSNDAPDRPWQEEHVLRTLYCEHEYSLRETADHLGCSPETICRWLDRHDIETRQANDQKTQPCYEVNPEGYEYVKVDHGDTEDRVGIHELVAIASGADPYEVFTDETHCHHRLRVPSDFDDVVQLDFPANLEVRDAHEHLSAHKSGDITVPDPEQIVTAIDPTRDQ